MATNLATHRISSGEYRIGEFLILRGGSNYWQVRDRFEDIIEEFSTLRAALRFASLLLADVEVVP